MCRKSYCTTPGDSISSGVGRLGASKMFKFYIKVFSCDGQGPVRLTGTLTGLVIVKYMNTYANMCGGGTSFPACSVD